MAKRRQKVVEIKIVRNADGGLEADWTLGSGRDRQESVLAASMLREVVDQCVGRLIPNREGDQP